MDSQAQEWMRVFFESPKGFASLPTMTRGALVLLATELGSTRLSFDVAALCAPLRVDETAFLRGLRAAESCGWLTGLAKHGDTYTATLTIPEES